MPKLSVVIITLNEERNIGRCLESVKDIADEIVVVDSFSTDKTQEICESYRVKFIRQKFLGYIAQKQFALEQAGHDHILSLDADESLSMQLAQSIVKVKNDWKCDAYSMNRLANYCGQWIYHCGWYPDKKIRLFDRKKAKWGGADPHDEIILEHGCSIGHLSGDIYHYTYYSISEHIKQADHFSDVASKGLSRKSSLDLGLKIVVSPPAKFFRNYLFHLGFLDGYYGLVICSIAARETFLKYFKAFRSKNLFYKKKL